MEDFSSNTQIFRLQPVSDGGGTRLPDLASVDSLAHRCFSNVPSKWVEEILRSRGLVTAMPMYDSVFLSNDEWLTDRIRRHVSNFEFGEDEDIERQRLIDAGWQVIPRTGFFVYDLDGRLLLSVDGTGYDFFEAHWQPLYEVLKLEWHCDD